MENKSFSNVSYGTNGFFLFKDNEQVNDAQSGNGNNFTLGSGNLNKTEDRPSNIFCTSSFTRAWFWSSIEYHFGNTKFAGNWSHWQNYELQ